MITLLFYYISGEEKRKNNFNRIRDKVETVESEKENLFTQFGFENLLRCSARRLFTTLMIVYILQIALSILFGLAAKPC